MLLYLLLGAAAVTFAWWKGWLGKGVERKLGAVIVTILALWLLSRGQWAPAIALGIGAGWLGYTGWTQERISKIPMDELEARRVLGVGLDATEAEIIMAHRRIISDVHPDRGGDPEMARRVNAARDRLIVNKSRRG